METRTRTYETYLEPGCHLDILEQQRATVSTGKGGSMARFALLDHYLYVVNQRKLYTLNIENPRQLVLEDTDNEDDIIETIFAYDDKLFLGAASGMYVYSLDQKNNPVYKGGVSHFTSCDPVVVDGDFAYVTLNSKLERRCSLGSNELLVLDVKDIMNPRELATMPMTSPMGLAVIKNHLYICEGEKGLSIIDVTNKEKPTYPHLRNGFDAYDVIALPERKLLILIGKTGLWQFELKSPTHLVGLSAMTARPTLNSSKDS